LCSLQKLELVGELSEETTRVNGDGFGPAPIHSAVIWIVVYSDTPVGHIYKVIATLDQLCKYTETRSSLLQKCPRIYSGEIQASSSRGLSFPFCVFTYKIAEKEKG
jgi:hypothetical protein